MFQRVQHFDAYGIIVKGQEVLLVKKTRGPHEGLWDLPGGKIEFGETPDTALVREVMEETGLEVLEYAYIKSDSVVVNYVNQEGQNETLHQVGFIYSIKVKDTQSICPSVYEEDVISAEWFDLTRVSVDELTPFVQEIVMDGTLQNKAIKKN